MATRIRAFDWIRTPLGDIDGWPPHLRANVDLMLGHGFPMIILWGESLIQLYNDGYAQVLGDKHPGGLGLPTQVCWPEVWHINGPIYERVWQGETITYADKLYPLARRGGELEDAWITLTYSPLRNADGRIEGVLVTMFETTEEHRAQAAREAAVAEARKLAEHKSVLVAELQHRVRNLMAMISSIAWRTQATACSVEDYAQRLSGRLTSLSRTQALLTRAGNAGVSLRELLDEELAAAAPDRAHHRLDGADLLLAPKAAEVLSLAVHELTTNALKHGALSHANGLVEVTWVQELREEAPWLVLHWRESGVTLPNWQVPERRGFGSALVEERVPYELGGEGAIEHQADGVRARIAFPLRDRDSIFQTDAPSLASAAAEVAATRVAPDWAGRSVLVVDDDFHLAYDTATALRSVGARIVGPCSDLPSALGAIAQRPDVAVVDINLGEGRTAVLVTALKEAGIPFVVVTGYDASALPFAPSDIHRIQKPASADQILHALASCIALR